MESTSVHTSRKFGAALAIATLVLGIAGVVSAQSGPSGACSGTTVQFGSAFFGLEDGGNRLLSTAPVSREFALATPLAEGTYELNAVSYDGYEQRETIAPQTQEQWYAELLGADGSVVATSGTTADLEDETEEASWSGSLGSVTLSAPVSVVRVVHAAPGSPSVNSVRPVCLGAVGDAPEEPETPETTAPPVAPPSSITVDFVSTSTESSNISITCGDLQESALGTEAILSLQNVPASTGCVVLYPADLDCTLSVDPGSNRRASTAGAQNVTTPPEGGANIAVVIDCVDPQIAAPVAPKTTTPPKAVVEAKVAGQVETAPTAQAQPGAPAFTG